MKPIVAFVLSVLPVFPATGQATRYSYRGRDPGAWTHTNIESAPSSATGGEFSTFAGEGANEYNAARIVTDAQGNTYIAGSRLIGRNANDFPLYDTYVTKLDPAGRTVFTATMGGKGSDQANAIALDGAGNIYVGGNTSSPNFPLRNALQPLPGSSSGFIVKLSPDGSQLLYSTFFGGTKGWSTVSALAVDAAGNLYVTGTTTSPDFPHSEGMPWGRVSFSGVPIATGALIAKISAKGDKLLYSGLIAGSAVACQGGSSCFLSSRNTVGVGIGVDTAGNAYVAGNTNTTDLPTTPGALRSQGIGAFAARVNAAGTALDYLTYIGATRYVVGLAVDVGNTATGIVVDGAGNAYIAGYTSDPSFPATANAFQTRYGGPSAPPPYPAPAPDAFVAKLSSSGAGVWATYLGGDAGDAARAIALDAADSVWLTGTTASAKFPNRNGWSEGNDFVAGFNPNGSALIYSARYPNGSVIRSVAPDPLGRILLAGANGVVSAIVPDQVPARRVFGLTNAAGGAFTGRVAPGEVISIYGPAIGPATPETATAAGGYFPTSLGGVVVLVDGAAAPLLYVSATQINAVVPFGVAGKDSARLSVVLNGVPTPEFRLAVAPAIPEIFRNVNGSAAAVNQDGRLNSAEHPAKLGSVVSIWATGTSGPAGVDGQVASGAYNFYCCQVQAQGEAAEVVYSGAAPGIVAGVTQINFRIPDSLYISGNVIAFTISAAGKTSNEATVYVTE